MGVNFIEINKVIIFRFNFIIFFTVGCCVANLTAYEACDLVISEKDSELVFVNNN
jgi:uncharacterized membrane protein